MDEPDRQARRQLTDGGRRLKALRALLGLNTPAELASHLQIAGLSASVLIDIESPGRPRKLWDYEAAAIADAVGVPTTFFTAPLEHLGDVRG